MKIATTYAGATEYVCALGFRDQLVAVSHECDFPPGVETLPRLSSTHISQQQNSLGIHQQVRELLAEGRSLFEIHLDVLRETGADTLITQSQCGVCAVSPADLQNLSEALGREVRVLSLSPNSYQDVLDDVLKVGAFLGAEEKARDLLTGWNTRTEAVRRETRKQRALARTAVLEWLNPPMAAGHWTAEMVEICGGAHDLNPTGPARLLSWQEVVDYNPQLLLLIPCGFDLPRTLNELAALPPMPGGFEHTAAARDGRIYALDGLAYFNRSGPRLVDSLELMAEVIHPEKFAGFFRDRPRRQAARQVKLG